MEEHHHIVGVETKVQVSKIEDKVTTYIFYVTVGMKIMRKMIKNLLEQPDKVRNRNRNRIMTMTMTK